MKPLADGILLPLIATAVVLGIALRVRRQRWNRMTFVRLAGALAVNVGWLAGFLALGFLPLKPESSWHWLPYLAPIATVAGLLDCLPRFPRGTVGVVRGLAALFSAWMLIPTWPDLQPVRLWWLAGCAITISVLWCLLDRVALRWTGARIPWLLTVASLSGAAVLFLSGSGKFAQMAGVLAASLGGFGLVARRSATAFPILGAIPGTAVLLAGLMVNGYLFTFSDVSATSFALILIAPAGVWLFAASKWSDLRGRTIVIGQTISVCGMAGLAVLLALVAEWDGLMQAWSG